MQLYLQARLFSVAGGITMFDVVFSTTVRGNYCTLAASQRNVRPPIAEAKYVEFRLW